MTAKDQAIARFVEAVKLDGCDWEDWPKDSREAFIALQQAVKALTDVEIEQAARIGKLSRDSIAMFRAVIAADNEKRGVK